MIDLRKGDCLELMKSIPDKSVDLVLTDTPYGTTRCRWDSLIPFEPMWMELKRVVKDDGVVCLFGGEPFSSYLRLSNVADYKYDWVWVKEKGSGFLNSKLRPLNNIEDIMVFHDSRSRRYTPQMSQGKPYKTTNHPNKTKDFINDYGQVETINDGTRFPLTTLNYPKPRNPYHPAQKPVELLSYLIRTYTKEGEMVLDFTMGSGSTGVACVYTKRNFIGMELTDEYYDVATKRIHEAELHSQSLLF